MLVWTASPGQAQAATAKGAKLDNRDKAGQTRLMFGAVLNYSSEVITVLLNTGAKNNEIVYV